jgi:hypothetical protein
VTRADQFLHHSRTNEARGPGYRYPHRALSLPKPAAIPLAST